MREWSERAPEIAHLINPAFCSLLLREFVRSYDREALRSPDASLLFIALPLVLHGDIRRALPATVATRHHVWLENRQPLRVGFGEACRALVPYVKEAVVFGCHHRILTVSNDGNVVATRRRLRSLPWTTMVEPLECVSAARFVGRWLAHAGPTATVYSLWGIKP